MKVCSPDGYALLHRGMQALATVEANGMRIDVDRLDAAIAETRAEIAVLTDVLRSDVLYTTTWKRRFGSKSKVTSGEQLAVVLFDLLGYPCRERTASGAPSAADVNLTDIDLPFVRCWRRLAKLSKACGTFLEGIRRYVTSDGLLHPNFNLHIAASYRSSSDNPNFQNFPARNEEMSRLVRSVFIPRRNHRLVECDFSGIEVGIACCYNKDKNLIHDFTVGDMHRDMAAQCYLLKKKQVTKPVRQAGKGGFVFPQFYGAYHIDCARDMWEMAERQSLTTADGVPILEHLASKGITSLGELDPNVPAVDGTFVKHLEGVQDTFWNVRYRTYSRWKRETWEEYQRTGQTELYTGFVCSRDSDGLVMNRKQVINYRIQGSAFHCLLWCLIELNDWLEANDMRTKIVSQIHDSIILDVHKREFDDVLAKADELMTRKLIEHWPWIIVPLRAEVEACELGGSWFEKKKLAV